MSSLGSPNPFFIAGKKAYEVERSLRFNPADIANLERTFGSAGNRRTWTFSFWYKRSGIGRNTDLFGSKYGGDGANENRIYFQDNDQLRIYDSGGISGYPIVRTAAKFRDVGAWYHFVVAVDTTQSTASNRVKIYANNVLQELDETTYGNQNQQLGWNNNLRHRVGAYGNADSLSSSNINSGYMAEVNFIDGFQYDPSYFGETDVITGQWNPKKYTGSYGTNGFYLNFSDNSGTTATTLGKDSSGNGNNFTPNNFSVAAGVGNDSVEDTPTNNFCTLNAVAKGSGVSLSQGNLGYNSSGREGVVGTFAVRSGKWYWEVTASDVGADTQVGIYDNTDGKGFPTSYLGSNTSSWGIISGNGNTIHNTSQASYGSSFSDGDILMVALDMDNGKWYLGKNGSWYNSGDPASSTNPAHSGITSGTGLISPAISNNTENNMDYQFNFGQRAFSYTPPTGFEKLNSANLPDPTIKLPNKHFNTLIWTGNSTNNRAITGLNFQPDFVWIKKRTSSAAQHSLVDSLHETTDNGTGNGNVGDLDSSSNRAPAAQSAGGFESFDANGFTLGKGNNDANADSAYQLNNASGQTYVAWNWNFGDSDGKTYTVTVVSDSGNKYRFDGFGTSAVTLDLAEGGTYIFNYPSAHPFRFSETSDGTHGGGSEYTTGVTVISSTSIQIVVAASAPTLYYYCSIHSGMGGAINTNTTLGSSNFDGSIQTTVKTNATAGMSAIRYTGTGSDGTLGHGLGVAPSIYIVKRRSSAKDWYVQIGNIAGIDLGRFLKLNSNTGIAFASDVFAATADTSSVINTKSDSATNGSSDTYIIYCFSNVEGYSKAGIFTGNGASSGTYVYTGFRPAFILFKNTVSGHNWELYDTTRPYGEYNPAFRPLYANHNYVEEPHASLPALDILSNGFKPRSTWSEFNQNGSTILYLAFAESPFKNARAR